jgi:hypothetical protein
VCYPSTTNKEFCDGGGGAGDRFKKGAYEVASEADSKAGNCVSLEYFQTFSHSQNQFQPRACTGRFPIWNKNLLEFRPAMRLEFMYALANRLNNIWGLTHVPDVKATADTAHKFQRPLSVRLKRVQNQKGLVQVYVEIKEFCMVELRTGEVNKALKYNQDKYCDKKSVIPDMVFNNLTDILNTKALDRGMMIGRFNIRNQSKPGWPVECRVWQPEDLPEIPRWVWMLTSLGAMFAFLSLLILQHKYRNRASYVRHHESLRQY